MAEVIAARRLYKVLPKRWYGRFGVRRRRAVHRR